MVIDFSRSFLTFRLDLQAQPAVTLSHVPPTSLNNARIQIECRCTLTRLADRARASYALGASCKTEQVGAERDLWLRPNADFCLTVSPDEFLVIKSWARRGLHEWAPERQSGAVRDAWCDLRIHVHETPARDLAGFDAIFEATMRQSPLVAVNEWEENGYAVCLEYPAKTFNVSERERIFQTDTGPLLLPDLSPERLARGTRLVECFDLAYGAFAAFDWIEFVINEPYEVAPGVAVDHYHRERRIDGCQNSLWEIATG